MNKLLPGLTKAMPGRSPCAAAVAILLCLAGCSVLPDLRPAVGRSAEEEPGTAEQARYQAIVQRLQDPADNQAAADLQRFSERHPELSGPLLNLALVAARTGDEAAAVAYLEQAAANCQRCGPVYNELGVLRRRQGDFEAAEKAYRRSIALEPGYGLAYYNLAVLYELYIQRPELAVDAYQQFLASGVDAGATADVTRRVTDLKRRVSAPAQAAKAKEG